MQHLNDLTVIKGNILADKYEKTEIVFIAHDTQPYEVDEKKFFNRGSSGGTMVSPTLE